MSLPEFTLLYIFAAGILMMMVWRFAGFLISSGLREDSGAVIWLQAVSTALISGLLARMILFPPGALADVAAPFRLGAFAFGVAIFYLARRHLGLGVLAGVGALALLSAIPA